jgi:hypothetical protein
MIRRRLLALLLVTVAAAAPSHPRADMPAVADLLDRYARGDAAGVVAALERLDDFHDLLVRLKKEAPAWITAAGATDRSRRTLTVATVALEAARVDEWREWKLVQHPPPSFMPLDTLYWKPPPLIITWASHLFSDDGLPTADEHLWQLAAIAVAERAEDFEFLIGSPYEDRSDPGDEITYLGPLVKRFPHETRFILAQGIALEWRSWPAKRRSTRGTSEAERVFDALGTDPIVGGEAMVRRGELALRASHSPGDAIQLFDRADLATRDPYVAYLARFLKGQAFEAQHRDEDAIAAYHAALRVIPRAQSASIALAARLFLTDHRTEAATVIASNMSGGPQPLDPWRTFGDADDRFWPELIGRLRAAITR